MNTKCSRFGKIVDRFGPVIAVMYYSLWTVFFMGVVRAGAVFSGMNLTHHWYDAPACWFLRQFLD